jgi:hypothetical protein
MSGPSNPIDPKGKNPLECNQRGRPYLYHVTFVTNSTNAPDGVVPAYSDHTVARSAAGVYTITLTTVARPDAVFMGVADAVGTTTAEGTLKASYRSYASGVFTVAVGVAAGTGVTAFTAADTTDVTVNCLFLCNGNTL